MMKLSQPYRHYVWRPILFSVLFYLSLIFPEGNLNAADQKKDQENKLPSFVVQESSKIRTKAALAGITEIYFIVGNIKQFDLHKVEKFILWNHAAKLTYGSMEDARRLGKTGVIQPGVNWDDPFGKMLRSMGINEGFIQSKLYEIWHPKFIMVGKSMHRVLIFEHWRGDVVGRGTALKKN